ncbi:hypothetical protein [Pseudogemmobacter bohemicus]|uniref:hypothetical protein n=1 Tax=Pseudogemmobacter bohemicus TaxID=2250708 RepID=UPI0018E50F87|nr:hypothetical protein [Pseudogemmobacter bohemicus]
MITSAGNRLERTRAVRGAVGAALSDIILLGTEVQVRLAARAAADMAAGQPVPTAGLVVSLRAYIREALDLEPVPDDVTIPSQGPARVSQSGGKPGGRGGSGGGTGGEGGGGMGGGMGMGLGRRSDESG